MVVRSGGYESAELVYPDHLKYDLTQKQPYTALFERLKHFLLQPDTLLLTVGFLALAIGLLWIGQGTGAIKWPASSFMVDQLQWAGYGAMLSAVGLILIWQGKR